VGILGNHMEFSTKSIPEVKILANKLQALNIFLFISERRIFSEGEGRKPSLSILLIRNMLRVIC